MTQKELLEKLRDFLQAMVWGATSNQIFGENGVNIVPNIPIWKITEFARPTCFLVEGGYLAHPEYPAVGYKKFNITVYVENEADGYGTATLMGANRDGEVSEGAGAKDILSEIIQQVSDIEQLNGEPMELLPISDVNSEFVKKNEPSLLKTVSIESSLVTA